MRLQDFPVPRNRSKRGMHWSASCYPEEPHWRERLAICRDMGIGWIKFIDDGGASGLNVYRACWHDFGIVPVIRFYLGMPGACGPRESDAIKRIADALGFATYFELCNEPDLPLEWGYKQPRDWLYRAVNAYVDYAPKVLAVGGLPGTFALASGAFGNLRIDERGNEIPPTKVNFLRLIHEKNPNILGHGGWVAMHNYHLNHPIDYPYDAVNQKGVPLTEEEYKAAPPWAWDHRPMAAINAQRARDKNPGDTIWDDDSCFNAWMVFQEHLRELGLSEVPICTTEGGPTMTRGDDGRYCKTHPALHADVVEQTYRALAGVRNYLFYAHWLLYNTTGGWPTDCWLGGSHDHSLTISRMKNNPVGTWGEIINFEASPPSEPAKPSEPPAAGKPTVIAAPSIDVPADWGVNVQRATPQAGQRYVVARRVRVLPPAENAGKHHIFVNVVQDGTRLYNSTVEILNTGNGWRGQVPLEKAPPEPMGNHAMNKGDTIEVWVSKAAGFSDVVSDRVTGLHTRHADRGPGSTWGHHSFEITFEYMGQYAPQKPAEPVPTPPPAAPTQPTETLEQFIRRKSWDQVGVNYNPEAALAKHAARHGLGKPETREFDVEFGGQRYRVQCFTLGIVYCPIDEWDRVSVLRW